MNRRRVFLVENEEGWGAGVNGDRRRKLENLARNSSVNLSAIIGGIPISISAIIMRRRKKCRSVVDTLSGKRTRGGGGWCKRNSWMDELIWRSVGRLIASPLPCVLLYSRKSWKQYRFFCKGWKEEENLSCSFFYNYNCIPRSMIDNFPDREQYKLFHLLFE